MVKWLKRKKWLLVSVVLVGMLASLLGIQVVDRGDMAPGQVGIGIGWDAQKVITLGHVAYAAGSIDYTYNGTDDDVQFQAALDALPVTGGRLVDVSAVQKNFSATVTRAIPNVTITGSGAGSYFTNDGVTPLFTAGGNGWCFQNLRTDAGGIDMGATTGWLWFGVNDGATAYDMRMPSGSVIDGEFTGTFGTVAGSGANVTRSATYVIAASDATSHVIAQADYVCDGTADEIEIQAAIDDLTSGGMVQLSQGNFTLSDTILLDDYITIQGEGWSTIITQGNSVTTNQPNIFTLNGKTGVHIRNMKLVGTGVAPNTFTSTYGYVGDAIMAYNGSTYSYFEDLLITDAGANAFDTNSIVELDNQVISGTRTSHLYVNRVIGVDSLSTTFDIDHGARNIYITDSTAISGAAGEYAFNFSDDVQGSDFVNCRAFSSGNSFYIGSGPRGISSNNRIINCYSYDATNVGLVVTDAGNDPPASNEIWNFHSDNDLYGAIINAADSTTLTGSFYSSVRYTVQIQDGSTNTYLSVVLNSNGGTGNAYDGIKIDGSHDTLLDNCQIYNQDRHGILILGGSLRTQVSGGVSSGSVNGDGLMVNTASLDTIISGFKAYNNAGRGIRIQNANVLRTVIYNSDLRDNVGDNFSDAGSPSTTIRSTYGYVTENSGTATIANGNTSIVVTHGLATTPTRVQITPRENPTNAVSFWWVDTLTATQFTININADPGASGLDFDWRAVVGEGN